MSINTNSPWRFCTAPMMDWSDRHCRFFWRLLSKRARLYTEMVTSGALIHGDRQRFLAHSAAEHPIALQLGGHNPRDLTVCAQLAEEAGFDEVNLNCGCPSDRVQDGRIGACLMAEPQLVAECVAAMQEKVAIPVTVKHRLGIDDFDSQEQLVAFVEPLIHAGCKALIIHARKAWLQGLSPKENREIPPLEYQRVADIKRRYPETNVVINGGITDLQQCTDLLEEVDGVMIGREAYHNPYLLSQVDRQLFGELNGELSRSSILQSYTDYCREELQKGTRLHHMTRHILGLFSAQPGGRLFRQHLSMHANKRDAGINVLLDALQIQREAAQRASTVQQANDYRQTTTSQTCIQSKLRG